MIGCAVPPGRINWWSRRFGMLRANRSAFRVVRRKVALLAMPREQAAMMRRPAMVRLCTTRAARIALAAIRSPAGSPERVAFGCGTAWSAKRLSNASQPCSTPSNLVCCMLWSECRRRMRLDGFRGEAVPDRPVLAMTGASEFPQVVPLLGSGSPVYNAGAALPPDDESVRTARRPVQLKLEDSAPTVWLGSPGEPLPMPIHPSRMPPP